MHDIAEWRSLVSHQVHALRIGGSNPSSAIGDVSGEQHLCNSSFVAVATYESQQWHGIEQRGTQPKSCVTHGTYLSWQEAVAAE